MTTLAVRTSLIGGLALTLSVAIASCGGTVRDSLGDPDPESGGGTTAGTGASSGGGSKATGAGGTTSGGGAVGKGAVPGTGGKSGGGTVGVGGKGGTAGAIASGGKAGSSVGGKAGSAGVPATGGVPVDRCSGVLCEPLSCPVGTVPYLAPGTCCAVCSPKCGGVSCPLPKCKPNEILTMLPGECCPICQAFQDPDAGPPCNASGYSLLRDTLEQKYRTTTCLSDSDCTAAAVNMCGRADCGIALPLSTYMSFVTNLQQYALANCTGCAPITLECPTTTPRAKCLGNYCTFFRE
jgi:hypothetical protein